MNTAPSETPKKATKEGSLRLLIHYCQILGLCRGYRHWSLQKIVRKNLEKVAPREDRKKVERKLTEKPEKRAEKILAKDDFNGYIGHCKSCGGQVADYNCNEQLLISRPDGATWDWWVSCINPDCKNHHGEGIGGSMDQPEWVEPPMVKANPKANPNGRPGQSSETIAITNTNKYDIPNSQSR